MNNLGKTLTIFLSVIVILLLSLTVITLFFFQKENTQRILAEHNLQMLKDKEIESKAELKEANKQKFLAEEKLKEADEQINSFLDDLELEKGLREELKDENQNLKEALANESQAKESVRGEFEEEMEKLQAQIIILQELLKTEKNLKTELEKKIQALQKSLEEASVPSIPSDSISSKEKIQLEKKFSITQNLSEGEVLSVDSSNEFLIINLGQNQGVIEGLIMSIYRMDAYLGDVRVSRVQEDMSAVDIIPPLSFRKIRKRDRVVIKQ